MSLSFDYWGEEALDVMEGSNESVFLTGKAGTGKSTLVRHFLAETEKNVLVVAPTGVAAITVGGVTIHSFFQFHPGITVEEVFGDDHFLVKQRMQVLYNVDTIVVDEISMVRADLLDCMDKCLREALGSDEPFAGLQMIFVGDLYQLPPIVRREEQAFFRERYRSAFFFSSHGYQELAPRVIELQHIYRQEDEAFKGVLNKVRLGLQDASDLSLLNQRVGVEPAVTLQAISLMTTNRDVASYNQMKLNVLDSDEFVSFADIGGKVSKSYFMNDVELRFKVGAQVMMLVNESGKYVNGSIGVIRGYDEDKEKVRVEIEGKEFVVGKHAWTIRKPVYDQAAGVIVNDEVGRFVQFPFKLAWALTIHKAQGLTFHHVRIDLGERVFAGGQTYVALSRATSVDGIYLVREVQMRDIRIDKRIMGYMGKALLEQKKQLLTQAIDAGQDVCFHYVKFGGDTTVRTITPREVGVMEYQGREFVGVRGHCHLREAERVFSVGRMYELGVVRS